MFDGLLEPGTLVLIGIVLIIAVYLYFLDKKTKNDTAAALCKTYAVMTEELLASVPDDQVVQAVAANLLNKQDKKHPDPALQLSLLSRGRAAVYSVFLLCRELETQDFSALVKTPSYRYAEPAVDGLERIGATNSATALRAAIRTAGDETPLWEAVTTVFREAIAAEKPLELCVKYIRENPDEFID